MQKTKMDRNDRDANANTSVDANVGTADSGEATQPGSGSSAHAAKLLQRRQKWQFNGRLGMWSIVVLSSVVAIAGVSYWYNSNQTASTFLRRAQEASDAEDFSEQAKWLRRYSLLEPDDLDAVAKAAIAADNAAENAAPANRYAAVDSARKQLSSAIGRLGTDGDQAQLADLRGRLIERLLQLGSYWSREAERQVVTLDAEHGDPQAVKWLAQALIGQVEANTYQQREAPQEDNQQDYWNWLAQQTVGDVVALAVELNKNDLDLITNFLSLIELRPDLCKTGANLAEQEQSLQATKQKLEQAVAGIRERQDSRSQLIVYQLDISRGLASEAENGLLAVAPQAAERLQRQTSAPTDEQDPQASGQQTPELTWDFLLVFEAAKVASKHNSGEDKDQAAEWYELLTAVQRQAVPAAAAESAFLSAGVLQQQLGDLDQAIQIWERGLEQVSPHSLTLLWPLASAYSQGDSDEQAAQAVKQFNKGIEVARAQWTRATVNQLSRAERTAIGRQLDTAAWRLSVLNAFLDIRRGQRNEAINGLAAALTESNDLRLEASERLNVANILASLCKAEGLWDQAATAYDRAIDFAPKNHSLRAAAAEAWTRSGNRLRAMEQWRIAGNSDSWALQFQSVNATFEYQLRLPPEQRDFSGVRTGIQQVRRNLPLPSEIADENLQREVDFTKRRLDILDISVPPPGVSAEDHLRSPALADGIAKLAEQYPDDETVQAFAAERLAAVGKDELSHQSLARMESIVGPSVSLAIVKARIAADQSGPLAASHLLLAQAERDQERVAEVLQMAATFAAKANDPELAYQALVKIPEDQRNVTILFAIANVAKSLPADSKLLNEDGERLSPADLSLSWEQRLREREGDTGAYGQFLEATRIIEQLYVASKTFSSDNPAFRKARLLVRNILSSRPRWGEAIALEGWLLALQGQPDKAVSQLRRGIAAGDLRLQTRQLLMEQLYLLGRYAEVEREISAAAMSTEADIDKYSTARIGLLQQQGDFQRSLAMAESAVEKRPDDFVSYLVLAMTASKAAEQAPDGPERKDLVAKARTTLKKAGDLADANEPRIFAARLQIEIAHGDESSIRAEIEKIRASNLKLYAQLAMESQALTALEDYEAALALLEQAHKLKPSRQTQFAMIELYRRMQRHDDEIALLRDAYQDSPDNEGLRNDLAKALFARDGKDVNWKEISDLLSLGQGGTANNRFLQAMLLGSQGSPEQQSEAEDILRSLIEEQNKSSDDARRFLAVLLRRRLDATETGPDSVYQQSLDEILAIYETLMLRPTPATVDIYRYADFLLALKNPDDLPQVATLLKTLQKQSPGSLQTLDLGIRYATATGDGDSTPEIVRDWVAVAKRQDKADETRVATIAGATLLDLGFFNASVEWLELAYRNNSDALTNFVVALRKDAQFEKSINVCVEHFEKFHDSTSATLLVESLLHDTQGDLSQRHRMLIMEALDRHGEYAPLLESVATLRLQQKSVNEAIALYERVHKLAPTRIRTLNNLAMVYSELPGRAAEAIDRIDRAIEIAGELPELLDTKGVVLLKSGNLAAAETAFRAAIAKSKEPGYQFHLIVALLAQHRDSDAEVEWKSLDLQALDSVALTASEREQLTDMKAKFGQPSTDLTQQQ